MAEPCPDCARPTFFTTRGVTSTRCLTCGAVVEALVAGTEGTRSRTEAIEILNARARSCLYEGGWSGDAFECLFTAVLVQRRRVTFLRDQACLMLREARDLRRSLHGREKLSARERDERARQARCSAFCAAVLWSIRP